MIAVGRQDHQLAITDEVAQGVWNPLASLAVGGHLLQNSHMVGIHAFASGIREGSEQSPPRSRRQHQDVDRRLLHRAVVGERCRIQAHAVKADAPMFQIQDALLDAIGIEAAGKKRVAVEPVLKRHPSAARPGVMILLTP